MPKNRATHTKSRPPSITRVKKSAKLFPGQREKPNKSRLHRGSAQTEF